MKVLICGAALDTENMGVSALCHSTIYSLNESIGKKIDFYVADFGKGVRKAKLISDEADIDITLIGLRPGKKYWASENYKNVLFRSALGIRFLQSDISNLISEIDFVLDISGGDSFTDLYGGERFKNIVYNKMFFLNLNKKLILLPQTYGPYKLQESSKIASEIVKKAVCSFARDENSYEILKMLNGNGTSNIHVGVDVAFRLPLRSVSLDYIDPKVNDGKTIGINVNGLIYNDLESASTRYGFKINYKNALIKCIEKLAELDVNKIILIPHVLSPIGHYESDYAASLDLKESLSPDVQKKVVVIDNKYTESELKFIISKMDWFMGTRMHATIAALSTKTPVCTISYSDKALGVFETCNMGDYVYDPRIMSEEEIIVSVLESFNDINKVKEILRKQIPLVTEKAQEQIKKISENMTKA